MATVMLQFVLVSLAATIGGILSTTDLEGVSVLDRLEVKGEDVQLQCVEAVGLSNVKRVEWRCLGCFSLSDTRETVVALSPHNYTHQMPQNERFRIVEKKGSFSLSIAQIVSQDSGSYFCLVNGASHPALLYRLAVQDVPSTPGRPMIMSFDSRSVNVSWAPPITQNHAPVTHYQIQILEGETEQWEKFSTITTKTGSPLFTIDGLQPFTVYSFRILAVNRIGPSPPSQPSYHIMTLREIPKGKPVITSAFNLSSSSVKISWNPPPKEEIHGEFVGYKISWRLREQESSSPPQVNSTIVNDPQLTKYTLGGLLPFTQYMVSLQVLNPVGGGPSATVIVITDEGVPSSPLNMSVSLITNTTITLHWSQPAQPNGIINGYRLYYATEDFTNVKTINMSKPDITDTIVNLEPYKKYTVWSKAFTRKHEGNSSKPIQVMSDVSGPASPHITNLSCTGNGSVYLEWTKPDSYYHSVDRYRIFYRRREEEWQEVELIAPIIYSQHFEKIWLKNLTENAEYSLYIQGFTQSLYQEHLIYPGNISEIVQIQSAKDCNRVQVSPMREEESPQFTLLGLAFVLGTSATIFLLIIAVGGFTFFRRRKRRNSNGRFLLNDNVTEVDLVSGGGGGAGEEDVPLWEVETATSDTDRTSAVPENLFLHHVCFLMEQNGEGFKKDFHHIKQKITECRLSPASSTTLLSPSPLIDTKLNPHLKLQRIDASGLAGSSCYYTEDPSHIDPSTLWNFFYRQKIYTVINVGSSISDWLPLQPITFGAVHVVPISTASYPSFTVQKFSLNQSNNKNKTSTLNRERLVGGTIVSLYLYHGALPQPVRWDAAQAAPRVDPRAELDFLRFVRMCSNACQRYTKAGGCVGPTATFPHALVVDNCSLSYLMAECMLWQLTSRREVNLSQYLTHLAGSQHVTLNSISIDQYIFVHKVVCEAILSSDGLVRRSQLTGILAKLDSQFSLEEQYSQCIQIPPSVCTAQAAQLTFNRAANNNPDHVAADWSRVVLNPPIGGKDYINASWIPGYSGERQYVITQHPGTHTTSHFWHMVWQLKPAIIINLSPLPFPYWPGVDKPISLSGLRVWLTKEGFTGGYSTAEITLQLLDPQSMPGEEAGPGTETFKGGISVLHRVQLLFCSNWPHQSVPVSNCVHLVDSVARLEDSLHYTASLNQTLGLCCQQPTEDGGEGQQATAGIASVMPASLGGLVERQPTMVVDSVGGTEAGIFCILSSLVRQMDLEDHVDIYYWFKTLYLTRPGIWISPDNLLFVYRVLSELCTIGEQQSEGRDAGTDWLSHPQQPQDGESRPGGAAKPASIARPCAKHPQAQGDQPRELHQHIRLLQDMHRKEQQINIRNYIQSATTDL